MLEDRSMVAAGVLVVLVLLSGCISPLDDGPEEANAGEAVEPANATSPAEPWTLEATDEVGCQAGVGHFTAGVYSYACLPGSDYGPCLEVSVPNDATDLVFEMEPSPVDTEEPGAGLYGMMLDGPGSDQGESWEAPMPGETIEYEASEPLGGDWSLFVVAQGAAAQQTWDVSITADGQSAQSPDELDPGDCG